MARRRNRSSKSAGGRIDRNAPASRPLSAAEQAVARDYLSFLRRWRRSLRLKVNADEALLVDGSRSPDHRGKLLHLLGKVDRSSIAHALERQPLSDDKVQQAEFLAGAARVTGDPGVLIDALEAQRVVATKAHVARAFSLAMRDIDMSRLSAARLGRLLTLVDEVFEPAERIRTQLALLGSRPFRAALDRVGQRLPEPLAGRLWALAAVHDAIFQDSTPAPDLLERGLREVLQAPPAVLDAQPKRVREGLVVAALRLDATWPVRSATITRLIDGLPSSELGWPGLVFLQAVRLCRMGAFDAARERLEVLLEEHPSDLRASALLGHLTSTRIGPIAGTHLEPGELRAGFSLTRQHPVWVRTDVDPQAVDLHRSLILPGIAPLIGVESEWWAVDGSDERLTAFLGEQWPLHLALDLALEGVRIIHLLTRLGLTLPDVDARRFLAERSPSGCSLSLADLTGLRQDPVHAEAAGRSQAVDWVTGCLTRTTGLPGEIRSDIRESARKRLASFPGEPPDPASLARWLNALR